MNNLFHIHSKIILAHVHIKIKKPQVFLRLQ